MAPISPDDAQALASAPPQSGAVRAFRVMDTLMTRLEVRLESVELVVGVTEPFIGVRADLHLVHDGRQITVPSCLVDGLVLANIHRTHIWMSEKHFQHIGTASEKSRSDDRGRLPSAFQELVQTLDLDGLGPDGLA
jgi:hypothetical protein